MSNLEWEEIVASIDDLVIMAVESDTADLATVIQLHDKLIELMERIFETSHPQVAEIAQKAAELAMSIVLQESKSPDLDLDTVIEATSCLQCMGREIINGGSPAYIPIPDGLEIDQNEVINLIRQSNDSNRRLILELEGLPIGEMNYRATQENVAEIGIKICDANQQNKGYGTTYIKMLMHYLFLESDYDKIILDTNLKNKRAQHVYQKLGFQKTATRLDSWKNQVGEIQSTVEYELTKDDYLKLYDQPER